MAFSFLLNVELDKASRIEDTRVDMSATSGKFRGRVHLSRAKSLSSCPSYLIKNLGPPRKTNAKQSGVHLLAMQVFPDALLAVKIPFWLKAASMLSIRATNWLDVIIFSNRLYCVQCPRRLISTPNSAEAAKKGWRAKPLNTLKPWHTNVRAEDREGVFQPAAPAVSDFDLYVDAKRNA
jgi:hypothetical protein